MNPLMSEIFVAIDQREADIELKARQRAALARAAMQDDASSNPLAGIVAVIRRFLDPRGHALGEATKRVATPPATAAPAVSLPTLVALVTPEIAPGDRHQQQAA